MRTFIRTVISIIAGFILMWPLGYLYGVLNWPTFHSWGLLHGGFFSAWPSLSILTFLALGYVAAFPRVEDTPLLIAGLIWGLVLTGFLGISSYLSPAALYGLLSATTAIVAGLGFFARRRLRLALLVVSPVLFFNMDFLLELISQPTLDVLAVNATFVVDHVKKPLIFALAGWALGLLARAIVTRLPKAV
jgi:hypothetical protein